jgi:Beta-lactamase enzyme family
VTFARRYTSRPHHAAALSVIAFLVLGCAGASGTGQPTDAPRIRTQQPLPSTPPSTARAVGSPFASLGSYLASRSGQVTAALYDARAHKTWLLDPGAVQDTASIVKVEIMGTALQEAEAAGRELPESEATLMPSMIENSNNQSATTLLHDVGGPGAVARFDRSAGMTHTTPSTLALIPGTSLPGWGLTTTTALDEVTLVSKFAYPNSVLSDASREHGLSLMENVEGDQRWGVSGGVPAGATVALKNGWLPLGPSNWQVNSIGWIAGEGRNYVLAVLTTGNTTEAYGIATIETISGTVFADLGSRTAKRQSLR